jgi:hypothetical protein
MKKAVHKSSESKKEKKRSEASTSASKRGMQAKLKFKQEVLTSESDETNSDYAEFLKTYDPEKEFSDSYDSS